MGNKTGENRSKRKRAARGGYATGSVAFLLPRCVCHNHRHNRANVTEINRERSRHRAYTCAHTPRFRFFPYASSLHSPPRVAPTTIASTYLPIYHVLTYVIGWVSQSHDPRNAYRLSVIAVSMQRARRMRPWKGCAGGGSPSNCPG